MSANFRGQNRHIIEICGFSRIFNFFFVFSIFSTLVTLVLCEISVLNSRNILFYRGRPIFGEKRSYFEFFDFFRFFAVFSNFPQRTAPATWTDRTDRPRGGASADGQDRRRQQ